MRARATGLVLEAMQGKLDGGSIRVPVPDGSLTDFTAQLKSSASVADLNAAFQAAADGALKGILEYSEEPLVSSDIVGNPPLRVRQWAHAGMGDLVKVAGWYDNEWGYSSRTRRPHVIVGAANER